MNIIFVFTLSIILYILIVNQNDNVEKKISVSFGIKEILYKEQPLTTVEYDISKSVLPGLGSMERNRKYL